MSLEKRGLSKNSILIIIILTVLVISVLIYSFAIKKEKISEPDPLSEQCSFACETHQKAAFCDVKRKVDETNTATCNELATNPQYSQYNVQACSGISCSTQQGTQPLDQTCVSGLGGTWEQPADTGRCVQSGEKVRRLLTPSDSPPTAGQICCK